MHSSLDNLVQSFQQQLDAATVRELAAYSDRGGRIFCGAGCSNCCSLVVNTTLPEAMVLASRLHPAQSAALKAHVEKMLADWDEGRDLKGYLRWHRQSVGACPLLNAAGECGVYRQRPLACRALLATRPSEWCAVDFANLSSLEKELFLGSLDRSAVAFPTHYFAASQELAEALEQRLIETQQQAWGFALSGNLTALLYLLQQYNFAAVVAEGIEAVAGLLIRSGLHKPLLLQFRRNRDC